jgi:hypothetical protein
VAQEEVSVHFYRRNPKGLWELETFMNLADEIELRSIGLRLTLRQTYSRVKFPLKLVRSKRKPHPNA